MSALPENRRDARGPRLPDDVDAMYRAHVRFVWRVAATLGVPDHEREDFTHDVFLVAHRRAEDRRDDVAITTWLFGIAKFVRLNRRRGQARHDRKLHLVEAPSEPTPPDGVVARNEAVLLVRKFLATLDESRRVAFELVEVEGMRAAEVAELCNANVNTIYTRLRSARKSFRQFVARRGG